jgi:HEAT repeat protein
MAQRSFKIDESFLQKLAIGAIGTKRVIEDLKRQNLNPIELERGSTGYKIWKSIKIKRVRVPDILSVNTGIRCESRAKTKLVIAMSHSLADAERGWDYGLKDDDYTALVVCKKTGDRPIDWNAEDLVQYIRVGELRKAFNDRLVVQEKPKGAEEGFELRVTWPSAIACSGGRITHLDNEKLQYIREEDNRTITLKLKKKEISLKPLVDLNQRFERNQILASVVSVKNRLDIPGNVDRQYYLNLLESTAISDRYCAVKAISHLGILDDFSSLKNRLNDENEHIYVRMEAAAALAGHGIKAGFDFIRHILCSNYLEYRLEAVIILGEVASNESCEILRCVLMDETQHPEIRGGAAWSLGELKNETCIRDLIFSFREINPTIRIEAARALGKMCELYTQQILDYFAGSSEIERSGIAWALSRSDRWQLDDFLKILKPGNIDMRQWVAYIIGSNEQSRIIHEIEHLKEADSELYFAVTVLWKIMENWIYELKEY